jgi:hypothetical protein
MQKISQKSNDYRISVQETMRREGLTLASPELRDSVVPACCTEGCEVEPDGYCEHGCPSILLALGVI